MYGQGTKIEASQNIESKERTKEHKPETPPNIGPKEGEEGQLENISISEEVQSYHRSYFRSQLGRGSCRNAMYIGPHRESIKRFNDGQFKKQENKS